MRTFHTIEETRKAAGNFRSKGLTIGFVPTMGALHEGHLELMRRAKKENDLLAVSIFVNPIQFNNPEDLKKYPRNLDHDRKLLSSVGCDLLFAPETEEMYPPGETIKKYHFGPLEEVMEGAFRPGHFNGVAVVVHKLFDIINPHRAYFGEKDFQQLAIIRAMVKQEKLNVVIVPCPIVRENNGLAMSSRNERLTVSEREISPFIHQTLSEAKKITSNLSPDEIRRWVKDRFKEQPAFRLEYFELAESGSLQPVKIWSQSSSIYGFIAVYLGNVRLIDNMRFI